MLTMFGLLLFYDPYQKRAMLYGVTIGPVLGAQYGYGVAIGYTSYS